MKSFFTRPVYPDPVRSYEVWPPDGHLVDATLLKKRALEVFPRGTTVSAAISQLDLKYDPLGSGFCLPRAGVLHMGSAGWRIRPMTQRERWVWRIPMDLYQCKPEDLQRIRGIGPSLAEKIYRFVQNRGYLNSITDLDNVPGIGEGRLELLRKEVEVP